MEVILLERIEKLGAFGDTVTVKAGFARNFLIPRKKALRATKENVEVFATRRAEIEADNQKLKEKAQKLGGDLEGVSVVLIRQAGDDGRLFGSVSSRDIAEAIQAKGIQVDNKSVILTNPIKYLGVHPVKLQLHSEVTQDVSVNVARTESEAQEQSA